MKLLTLEGLENFLIDLQNIRYEAKELESLLPGELLEDAI